MALCDFRPLAFPNERNLMSTNVFLYALAHTTGADRVVKLHVT